MIAPAPDPWCPSTRRHGSTAAYKTDRCRCSSARRLMAAEVARRRSVFAPRASFPVLGTQRRVHALGAAGYSQSDIGAELGISGAAVSEWLSRERVHRRTHLAVLELYQRLENEPGPNVRARTRAKTLRRPGPEWWAGVDMDDPAAVPRDPASVALGPDRVAVERIAAGELCWRGRPQEERRLAVGALYRRGLSVNSIAMLLERTKDPDANAHRMVNRDLAWLRERGLVSRRAA